MSNKKEKIVSKKHAKRSFNSVGLALIIYILFVLIIPNVVYYYLLEAKSDLLADPLMFYGIYFIILVLGTFIPFFLLKALSKVKTKKIFRPIKASFSELLIQTVVFFACCTGLIYVSSMILNAFGLQGCLLASIGLNYDITNLSNHIYVFMLLVVTPFIEEYAFRGVLLNALGRFGKRFALIASAIIFALSHRNIGEILPGLAMGLLLGKTALRYKSIQPTILIHILFNCFLYLLCVLPSKIATYMSYGIGLICVVAAYLILTKRYKKITVQKLRSNKITSVLFYSRPTIIICFILLIGHIIAINFFFENIML